jgi:membrane protease YdiL (CAAX protease family)
LEVIVLVTIVPLIVIAIVYPRLPERPFAGFEMGFWLLSAPAQELVYTGFLYGRFERLYGRRIFPRLDVPWAAPVTALFFSLWHLQNFGSTVISLQFVVFQLGYTFLGGMGHALIRHWTGSVWYPILMHMAVNWIAARP